MKRLFCMVLLVFSSLVCANSGGKITTLTVATDVIAAASNNPTGNFLNWRITGVCIWFHGGLFPYISQTWEVNEYLPDTMITVFNRVGENPLLYTNSVLDPILKKVGDQIATSTIGIVPVAGGDNASSHNDGTMAFKEVDVIGNPMAALISRVFSGMMIPSTAQPFEPYYSSLLDSVEWRDPKVDMLVALKNPGLFGFTIGLLDEWGALYPRNGYVVQPGDYKAAAVIALRGSDIATISGVGHVFNPLPTGSCGQNCTISPSSDMSINDFDQAKYQEIYPVESNTASQRFGVEDPIHSGTYGQDEYEKGDGDYVWVMWRHYSGCIQDGGSLIYAS